MIFLPSLALDPGIDMLPSLALGPGILLRDDVGGRYNPYVIPEKNAGTYYETAGALCIIRGVGTCYMTVK
uniref:Uncharacterized protein n=1 Tax=Candidatus Kentrum sp. FW TaxID=2126338 RepID=A0A450SWB3_9GAMM|nr:MAG: hypothetical protein BECKFW1821A_GA0114235_107912 [Candidatus Kentron sp. FW]